MYYLACDICCHRTFQERGLCKVDGNLWRIFESCKATNCFNFSNLNITMVNLGCVTILLVIHRLVESMTD